MNYRYTPEEIGMLNQRLDTLENAMRMISRMRVIPDDKANRFTLVMAIRIAKEALGHEGTEMVRDLRS